MDGQHGATTANPTGARARPRWLRALGHAEPPATVEVEGTRFDRLTLFKHDSWAATALYGDVGGRRLVIKFHRQQGLPGLPLRWFGRRMARHEGRFLGRLGDLDQVPRLAGPVNDGGRPLPYAVAREFIPGHPLARRERVGDDFFPALLGLLEEFHRRRIAYVDLHKRENIIVDEHGRPCLIDFQISVEGRRPWPFTRILRILQDCDLYHLHKHWAELRPDQFGGTPEQVRAAMPWWIRAHRLVARPFRRCRRGLLVLLRVRTGRGRAESELFPEDAVRRELDAQPIPAPHRPRSGVGSPR